MYQKGVYINLVVRSRYPRECLLLIFNRCDLLNIVKRLPGNFFRQCIISSGTHCAALCIWQMIKNMHE